jgi:7,8-dihydro-6-hydroxymethylpterin dimethyltransferase
MMGCCEGEAFFATESLCPYCLDRIPAVREMCGDDVYLVKSCPEHGEFRTIIWRGGPEFQGWKRQPNVVRTSESQKIVDRGCPFDCGICPMHRKNACTAVLEVTSRCNLRCAVCFADSGSDSASDPTLTEISEWYQRVLQAYGPDFIIQLSGGEPTIRDDLPAIIEMGRSLGFSFIQVNTNGLRLAMEEEYASVLRQAGAASVFFQFDGTEDEIYRKLRGRAFYTEKRRAIERCVENGIGVVLVPTIVPGVNTHNIGAIIKLALELSPGVRGVHFQPVGYVGRGPDAPDNSSRITLPDIMRSIEEQTDGLMRAKDFTPPGWENTLCSFHGTFIPKPGGGLQALTGHGGGCCSSREGSDAHAVSFTARQWSSSPATKGSDCCCTAPSDPTAGIETLEGFLEQVKSRMLSVSCMAFQDVWNLDLERARDCCIHVVAPDGRMIPFCLYNLTSLSGESLYRGHLRDLPGF